MNFFAWRSLALSSALVVALAASTRPHYGGALRVQVLELPAFDTSPLLAETLVRIDERGDYQPMLARSWQRDPDGRRWRFTLRQKVVMHDGTALTPAIAASILGAAATTSGQQLVIQSDASTAEMLERAASPRMAITRRGTDGSIIGTGPFRLAVLEPGRRAKLTAFDEHWAGRPYLDSVEISSERGAPADAIAMPVSTSKRAAPERFRIWMSKPRELIILSLPAELREIFALAIDRSAIAAVITQHRGEPAGSLLPEWLSGYAAAFPIDRDLARARHLAAALHSGSLTINVQSSDSLLRLIADRIALNVRDAGLAVSVGTHPSSILLARLRLPSNNAAQCLAAFARSLELPFSGASPLATPQALYDAENALVSEGGVVPVVYIPDVYALDPRIRNWNPQRLDSVWMEP